MTTDKERAEVLREFADRIGFVGITQTRLYVEADKLDPPKPTWPDGMFARVYFWEVNKDDVRVVFAERKNGKWLSANGTTSYELTHNVTKVEPLRVLGDDEIALPRSTFGQYQTASEARHRAECYVDGALTADIWRAYADALDAEAGDAK